MLTLGYRTSMQVLAGTVLVDRALGEVLNIYIVTTSFVYLDKISIHLFIFPFVHSPIYVWVPYSSPKDTIWYGSWLKLISELKRLAGVALSYRWIQQVSM
ncbi:hypothetical protein F4819DRAFT_453509 [Hypoxylon fuscum]|nr:hypothetical protein F4819DRAFT_453509 [Hypoxylon fuscum]